ncbi:MAG: glutaredoxin family protein [Gammaproteobacteria bacterium]|nr:glutaredoxin family protein [Gammaproteobacteria bacterium]
MAKKSDIVTWALLIAVFVVVVNFAEIRERLGGAVEYDSAVAGEVVLYSTAWCGYCRKTRRFFTRHDIPFIDLDVEKSPSARAAFERIGGRGVPVVTVGDEIVHGYNLARLRKLLECADCSN